MDVCDSVDADDRDILEASAALKDITKNVNTFISQQEKVRAARLPPGNTPLGAALGRVPAQGSDDGGCKKSPMPHVAAENASSRRVRRLFRARAREFPRRFGRSVLDAPPFFLLIVPDIPPHPAHARRKTTPARTTCPASRTFTRCRTESRRSSRTLRTLRRRPRRSECVRAFNSTVCSPNVAAAGGGRGALLCAALAQRTL